MLLVDSNVLIDVLHGVSEWAKWSEAALSDLLDSEEAAINPIIFAEVSAGFRSAELANEAMPSESFVRLPLPYEAAFLAGQAFVLYRRAGGARRSPLPDFYIGAHAAVLGLRLLTRDPHRYRNYFPTVRLVAP